MHKKSCHHAMLHRRGVVKTTAARCTEGIGHVEAKMAHFLTETLIKVAMHEFAKNG